MRAGERFELGEARRIRSAVARTFGGPDMKLRLAAVLFERAADEADPAQEMVVVTRAVRRMERG